jgi:hypothetical protein
MVMAIRGLDMKNSLSQQQGYNPKFGNSLSQRRKVAKKVDMLQPTKALPMVRPRDFLTILF